MTSDLCTDDVVVCIASPQVISGEGGAGGSAGRVAASSAAVELGRRLLLAARAGNTAQVLDLMAKGAPFTTDWLGTSPLHLAATNAHVDTCAVLLRAGVSRDARTKVERTPLHMAAYAGHADVVALLLQHDAAVDCRDMLRMTPLHWACARGHARAAGALLAAGAGLDARTKFGKTPRQLAAAGGHHDVLALLDQAADERQKQAERRQVSVSPAEPAPASSWRCVRDAPPHTAHTAHTHSAHDHTDDAAPGFQPLHRLTEIKMTNVKLKQQQDKTTTHEAKTESSHPPGSDTVAAALLRRHGITLLPTDDGSTVLSALQSGRTVVLSDAGKLMLKESSPPQPAPSAPQPTLTPVSVSTVSAAPEGTSPTKGLKLFTLNNKLLLHNNKPLGKTNITNVQLSQVKFVQLKDKLVSPKKALPLKAAKRPRTATPVKIIVNKNNYKLLGSAQQAPLAPLPAPAAPAGGELPAAGLVPAAGPVPAAADDSGALRAQLQAARKAIAALTAELASCKAKLAHFEQRQA